MNKWVQQALQNTRSIYKNQLYFYILAINNLKSEIKKTTEFTITLQETKYSGINLPKEMQELYTENYKTLFKGGLSKWKNIHIHETENLILWRCNIHQTDLQN